MKLTDSQKYELVYGCIKLFKEVDINGDGGMEWKEFLQYMLDAVSGKTIKGPSLENEDKDVIQPESVYQQISKIKASIFNRFSIQTRIVDKHSHYR
jgi:hypothetical protein